MSEYKGLIFNVQKFSIHDGAGIRTLVFMKGCPLSCIWCSNPESQNNSIEIMDVKSNCNKCGKCAELCSVSAIDRLSYDIDRSICVKCGICAQNCFAEAKKIVGKYVTVDELMEIIDRDRIFYRNSGGGVTVGGGEPLMQSCFVAELLKSCKAANIHTAIESSGYGKWEIIKPVFENADQIFMDIKCFDSKKHKAYIGVDNTLILNNAEKIAKTGKEIVFRIPIIPSFNDNEENIMNTGKFIKNLTNVNNNISLELLPYHDFGKDKYRWLNIDYKMGDIAGPDKSALENYKKILRQLGVNIV